MAKFFQSARIFLSKNHKISPLNSCYVPDPNQRYPKGRKGKRLNVHKSSFKLAPYSPNNVKGYQRLDESCWGYCDSNLTEIYGIDPISESFFCAFHVSFRSSFFTNLFSHDTFLINWRLKNSWICWKIFQLTLRQLNLNNNSNPRFLSLQQSLEESQSMPKNLQNPNYKIFNHKLHTISTFFFKNFIFLSIPYAMWHFSLKTLSEKKKKQIFLSSTKKKMKIL